MTSMRPLLTSSLTNHAVDRYRRHFPRASKAEVIRAVNEGSPVTSRMVMAITQRVRSPLPSDRYVLSSTGKGIFVIDTKSTTVVTYLRLGAQQQEIMSGIAPSKRVTPAEELVREILQDPGATSREKRLALHVRSLMVRVNNT